MTVHCMSLKLLKYHQTSEEVRKTTANCIVVFLTRYPRQLKPEVILRTSRFVALTTYMYQQLISSIYLS